MYYMWLVYEFKLGNFFLPAKISLALFCKNMVSVKKTRFISETIYLRLAIVHLSDDDIYLPDIKLTFFQ